MADPRGNELMQLLHEAYQGSPPGLKALLVFLITNNDIDPISSPLDMLDPSKIPLRSILGAPFTSDAERGLVGIRSIATIFQSLGLAPKRPDVIQERVYFGERVLERWSNVMRWMMYYLLHAPYGLNPALSVHLLTEVLTHVTVAEEKDAWQEELLYLPSTMDFLFFLLRQVDPKDGSYHYAPILREGCSILWLLWKYTNDPYTFACVLARLKAVNPRTRDRIISSLVFRARHIAEIACGKREGLRMSLKEHDKILIAGRSLYLLVVCTYELLVDPALGKAFLKHDFLFEYASALSILCTKAHDYEMGLRRVAEAISEEDLPERPETPVFPRGFWKLMADTIAWLVRHLAMKRSPKAYSSIPSALRGGILQTALRCLLHLDPEAQVVTELIEGATACALSFTTTRKGYHALTRGYQESSLSAASENELDDLLDQVRRHSKAGKEICKTIRDCVERGERTYEGYPLATSKLMIGMCGNQKHHDGRSVGDAKSSYKVCMRCHGIAYCSELCQREDWAQFHSKECKPFTKWYQSSQKDGQWAYFDVRRDCVLYLEDVANWNLYPLVDRGAAQYPKQDTSSTLSVLEPGQIYHADSSIAVFDFASFEGLVFKPKYSLDAYHNVCWRYINLEWDERVRRMCQDVKESNGCSCLAEGIFSHTQASCLFVLVKLGWHADAKDGRRYRVEESVWRLGPRPVTGYIWHGCEGDQ